MIIGRQQILLAVILIGVLFSCVKDPQDIPSGLTKDSVFGIEGSFGSENVLIEAGKNGWTMLPTVEVDNDSLVVYTSVFSQDGCLDDCNPSWIFKFYRALPAVNDGYVDFQKTIEPGEKEFLLSNVERDSFMVSLATHPALFLSGYSFWEDINGSAPTFNHEFSSVVGYKQNVNVCFQSFAFTGCQYTQCIFFNPATQVPCIAAIQPILENPRHLSLNVKAEGTAPFEISWFNGATTSGIVVPLQDSSALIYATVTVRDGLGNSSYLAQSIRLQNGIVDACYFPISLTCVPVKNTSPAIFADRLEIIYRDVNGVEWRNTAGIQDIDAHASISRVSSFEDSPFHQTAFLIEMGMKADLFDEVSGQSRRFQTNRLSLALSHN